MHEPLTIEQKAKAYDKARADRARGGHARARNMTKAERLAVSRKANRARWSNRARRIAKIAATMRKNGTLAKGGAK